MASDNLFPNSPVENIDTHSKHEEIEDGWALCLSGGGYRAMLFHVGALWRLNELGCLPKFNRISSVSGGSITSAVLGMNWNQLSFNTDGQEEAFKEYLVQPIRDLANKSIDLKAIFTGILTPGSVNGKLANAYNKYLFKGKTLQDLPGDSSSSPRFVINATNVQSGALWRFMKPYMRDWRVGEVEHPNISLAVAVAASSAFPPVLSPAKIELSHNDFTENSGTDLQKAPYTSDIYLCDGGVYDNLGIETVWKRYSTILVSDADGKMEPEPDPKRDWARQGLRTLELIDSQVRNLRKRQLISSYKDKIREGAYWGIRSDIENFQLPKTLKCPLEATNQLAKIKTRLKRIEPVIQEKLINWGYAVCDAALRKHLITSAPCPKNFPYPESGI